MADESQNDQTQSFVPLTAGTAVSHYRIIEKIGSGGMGEVYLAEDTQLDRKVALKFLSPHLCQDDECRRRFKREAQAAAKLSHPNMITIYQVSEYQGRPFFAMEHVEGRSLKEISADKELSIEQILELGIQICEGLHAAHDRGVTHRDIKPSNILIDSHGRAKIVDFGLASVVGSDQLTKTGSTLGTIGYMSPEQVQGKDVDHRSDLFSLGVVLYELITGRNPFKRDCEAATLKAVSDDLPEPLARFKSDLPDGLQAVIDKALEKDVRTRYQHADGVLADLMRIKRSLESSQTAASAVPSLRRRARIKWIAGALVAIAAVVALVLTKPWVSDDVFEQPDTIMLAVLPFENLGNPEDEYFADGITDEIISRLAAVHGLGVISRTSTLQYKGTSKNLREIGGELGVQYVLEGTIRWDKSDKESRVRINPQLIRVADDVHLWADRYDGVIDDIFTVQSSIAERVAEELDITLLESERKALREQATRNTDAYDFYLRGRRYFGNHNPKDYINAETMFQKAIALEPQFVKAHAWLSNTHSQIYSWYIDRTEQRLTAAREAAQRAIEIAPDLPDGHGALAWFHYVCTEDYDLALQEFTALREKNPSDGIVSVCIAMIERQQGKWQDAVKDFERAIRLMPRSSTFCSEYGRTLFSLRRYGEAEILFNRAIDLKPDTYNAYYYKSLVYLFRNGDIKAARRVLQDALQKLDRWFELTCLEARLDIMADDHDRALMVLNDICDISELPAIDSAYYYNLKGSAYGSMNQTEMMESCHDSARVILERLVLAESEDPWYHAELGVAFAGLGRDQQAVEEGQFAIELLPPSKDARAGVYLISNLAVIYVILGEYDLAIEQLDYVLSVPSELSVPFLRIWPDYAPLRDHLRFQALLKKHGI